MNKQKIELIIGALFHDIGKLLYMENDTERTHSLSGYEWAKEVGINNDEILRQIRYHHSNEIENSCTKISEDSLAYITYWADNVSSGMDGRDNDEYLEGSKYVQNPFLESVFNNLNGNRDKKIYKNAIVSDDGSINYPDDNNNEINQFKYSEITDNIRDLIAGLELNDKSINSILEILEANLSFVPSTTDTSQVCDISLYDHVKLTAAIASSAWDYLQEKNSTNYYEVFFKNGKEFYDKDCMLICSMDLSGIQNFIYTLATTRALKNLRARSFYLELMMEHIVDQLLLKLELSRANLLYTGGGHAYLILPNTNNCKKIIDEYSKDLNKWFIENFDTDLFIAIGYRECSADTLMNKPLGSYRTMFSDVSSKLSDVKSRRYTAEEILTLNNKNALQFERECIVCGKSRNLVSENKCEICDSLERISNDLIEKDFIVILSQMPNDNCLRLPENCYMVMKNRTELENIMANDISYVRCYGKNKRFVGNNLSTKLWMGDYCSHKEFATLADKSEGISRLGVLRADVDNLGTAFVSGFDEKLTSISRTATFSRKLSEFFKFHINYILKNPKFTMTGIPKEKRNALIVYSGGDDIFLIGAWDDVIEFAVDLNESLKLYAQNTLTISAGIGIYPSKYPVSTMAYETGLLEENSKGFEGKNAITLFDESNDYRWDDFKNCVVLEKLDLLQRYFAINGSERKNSFLYRVLEYIKKIDEDKINLARYAYLLARIKPKQEDDLEKEKSYNEFSEKMYGWIKNKKDRKEIITAIYLYVYLNRDKEGNDGEIN